MDRNLDFSLLVITVIIALVLAAFTLGQSHEAPRRDTTITSTTIVPATSLRLFGFDEAARPGSIVQLRLSNGTTIIIKDRNPFNFTIETKTGLLNDSITALEEIKLYKLIIGKSQDYVLRLAKKLGIDTNRLRFNNITQTYIYYNATHVFEYNIKNGFFRFKLRKIPHANKGSLPSNALIEKAISYLKSLGVFNLDDYNYTIETRRYSEYNRRAIIVTIVIRPKLDGIIIDNLAMIVLFTPGGKVVGVEGIVPTNIRPIGSYALKPPSRALKELEEYIREGRPMINWYISWLAFTKLKIESLKLVYYVTPDLYVVPVYLIEGGYELHYDNINDEGPIKAIMLAIES